MCYFTDKDYVKKLKGSFTKEELDIWAKQSLPNALKLQVGCGAEPTIYKHLDRVFELGKQYKVPHVSLTTNANLLTYNNLVSWTKNGLNEITISLHGVHKKTYEFFMSNGNYEKFIESLHIISRVKKQFPELVLRINYTFNEDNFDELLDFFKIFEGFPINFIQLRPISKIGETSYHNFSLEKIIPKYNSFIQTFKEQCSSHNVNLMAPNSANSLLQTKNDSSIIFNYTYFYVSPTHFWKENFDWKNESFKEFTKRIGWKKELFLNIFKSKKKLQHLLITDKLNYDID